MIDLSARRPLKSRSTQWATGLSRGLLRLGVTPNQVSVASSLFAIASAGSMLFGVPLVGGLVAWLLAATFIQMRLVCNLMDGMLAVEGGLKTHNGDLFNEFPDRVSDVVILAAMGYAQGSLVAIALGWIAACGALMTACVRMHGATLIGKHDFRGPMAKPQRMALATFACLAVAVLRFADIGWPVLTWALGVMVVGIAITVLRRLAALSVALHQRQTHKVP